MAKYDVHYTEERKNNPGAGTLKSKSNVEASSMAAAISIVKNIVKVSGKIAKNISAKKK